MAAPKPSEPNDIPEDLLGLAKLAISEGFDEVNLGFGGGSADEAYYPEWALSLVRRSPESLLAAESVKDSEDPRDFLEELSRRESIQIFAQRPTEAVSWEEDGEVFTEEGDDGAIRAYVGDSWPESSEGYIGIEAIRQWILTPLEGALQSSPEELAISSQYIEPFERAVRAGWEVNFKVGRSSAMSFIRSFGGDEKRLNELMGRTVEFKALNSYYNVEGHPNHRSTGAPLSISFSLLESGARATLLRGANQIPGNLDSLMELVGKRAPWFVPVAHYDPQAEDWIVPVEAAPENWRNEAEDWL